ncbi:MAG: hypothetical protein ACFBSG_20180 [Leptolyngbyaceae cyanobacterium]
MPSGQPLGAQPLRGVGAIAVSQSGIDGLSQLQQVGGCRWLGWRFAPRLTFGLIAGETWLQ